jgi:hypothetical protein
MRPRVEVPNFIDYLEDWSGNIRLLIAMYDASAVNIASQGMATYKVVSFSTIMNELKKTIPSIMGDSRYRNLRDILARGGFLLLVPTKRFKYDVQLTAKGALAAVLCKEFVEKLTKEGLAGGDKFCLNLKCS